MEDEVLPEKLILIDQVRWRSEVHQAFEERLDVIR